MTESRTILFLCPHNAAKSLLAVAYFERLARQRGLPYRADSAGTEPEAAPSAVVVATLRAEGIDVSEHRPRLVQQIDLVSAHRVVSMGCDLDDLAPPGAQLERWDDVPPVSHDLEAAYAATRRRVEALVSALAQENA